MSNWKFTDQYGSTYPALANSILSLLVFDVSSGNSPVSGTSFSASLDLTATGNAMNVLAALTGTKTIPITGTVTTSNNQLSVNLQSSDNDVLTKALAACIPIIGGDICKNAGISIVNVTGTQQTSDDEPQTDEIDLSMTIAIGSGTGTLTTQIPMSDGFFNISASFTNFGIALSDLNFLVPGNNNFSTCFPSTQLGPYYNNQTQLELLSLGVSLYVSTAPSFSVVVSGVDVTIGITNIPIYKQALYLNPLAIWINISNVNTTPTPAWGLVGNFVLCNFNRPGDTGNPDFTFDLNMGFPNPPDQPNFSLSGNFDNPYNQPVSQIVSDLLGQATDLGIGNSITLEKFDFATDADVTTGYISDFEFEIAMSGQFGIFENFSLESFSIAVAYSS
ncbi:hypothetical protein [[Flexibacter] sp. ATCC 35208]|uniref:hypothetical protein n=1 Tax=[Flexibacter] sp. ATCC 35208 TaxID=1936242 RepID=UPI0009CA0BD3|nr:hypothetical protein [[Flexibacter] sp. ATCC 35208]OMP76237.1 hypothetical protein BW716_26010 [[Flexibacter] sp. ATCC 35208]